MLNDFGFSEEKYKARMERYRSAHKNSRNVDEVVARMEKKSKAFNQWFIDRECDIVLEILREICEEFHTANSIYPSDTSAFTEEFNARRLHLDNAIAKCYVLSHELEYIFRTLPVDLNKYKRFDDAITEQVNLFKGVRKSDNRFLRSRKTKAEK